MSTVTPLTIAADHPAYAGHFPGAPILPGVVLLDAALRQVELASRQPATRWQIAAAKFQSAVAPGQPLTLEYEELPNGSIRFVIASDGHAVADGVLTPSPSELRREVGDGEHG